MSIQDVIRDQVTKNRVVLYMKGTPDFPQCGFSANAIGILRACGVEQPFTVNVLEDPEIRQGINSVAGLPGPGRVEEQGHTVARCGDAIYTPGVGCP